MIEVDTPEIRGALLARLGDDDGDTRLEALAGLAAREDERAIEPLIRELESSRASRVTVEAARDMGDTRLHPALAHLATWWDVDADLLAEALDSCKGRSE
jgi:HEAT repeat protein